MAAIPEVAGLQAQGPNRRVSRWNTGRRRNDAELELTQFDSGALQHATDRNADNGARGRSDRLIDDVVAAVNVKRFAGDQTRRIVREEGSRDSDIVDADKAPGRRLRFGLVE